LTTPRAAQGAAEDGARPLLAIDGDSFAHRSFHALPKFIRRRDGGSGGAIVGFANFLIRLLGSEQPRAVVVGWGRGAWIGYELQKTL
jgi:DNA polymerase I